MKFLKALASWLKLLKALCEETLALPNNALATHQAQPPTLSLLN